MTLFNPGRLWYTIPGTIFCTVRKDLYMEIQKSGMFAIVGRPNVGKSTLLNALAGEKIAIVSDKPQTTRNRIMAVVNHDGGQYVFVDTPGFHKPRNRLGDFMMELVEETVNDTDAVLLVVEPKAAGTPEEILIENIKASGLPCILIINKIDTLPKEELLAVIAEYQEKMDFHTVIPVSGKKKDGLDVLMQELTALLQDGGALFPEDMTSDQPERVIAAEIIREKMLWRLDREIPHGAAVVIEGFDDEEGDVLTIHATIYVEKNSHKAIVIGKQGAMLKEIGSLARTDLEKRFGTKVFLQLWVKVKEGWRDNLYQMRNFGYEN
ncbi:MAG: GTPase Era [Ruminococcaceae bacterium]|nr:GTPase Era [Oscillospiraceae bacterium]